VSKIGRLKLTRESREDPLKAAVVACLMCESEDAGEVKIFHFNSFEELLGRCGKFSKVVIAFPRVRDACQDKVGSSTSHPLYL
jgi:hypothetical protein